MGSHSASCCPSGQRARPEKGPEMGVRVTGQREREAAEMTEFYVKVSPGKESFSVERGSYPRVMLTEEAENGRANAELTSKLAEVLGEKPGIVSGHKSRRKKLKIDLEQEELEQRLEEMYGR